MKFPLRCLIPFALAVSPFLEASPMSSFQDLQVELKEPVFQDGILQTTQGGVISAKSEKSQKALRIQARKITYINSETDNIKIKQVIAEEDLLLEYEGRFFIGSKLEYDFITQTGTLWDGRTSEGIWFIGGDKVTLNKDGSFSLENAFLTTSESQDRLWDLSAKSIAITNDKELSASMIHLNIFHMPCLWIPSFKSNLGTVADPPIRYKITFDKGLWPKATFRYRLYSTEEFNLFARLDYRLKEGLGATLESEYLAKDKRTTFVTKSYGAYNKIVYDEPGLKRYRLQGLFNHRSLDDKTTTNLTYDKFSDLKMISDFPSSDFEITTQKRTRLLVNHQEDIVFSTLTLEPRLNTFESINQKLPLLKIGVRPISLGSSGILVENSSSAGYLDYVYAHDLLDKYPTLHETHAARLETKNKIYRPFVTGPLHFTPYVGVVGIFYNNNPWKQTVGQGSLIYGGNASAPFYKKYAQVKHSVMPYCVYTGLSHPRAPLQNHYTFSIDDGLYQLSSLKIGVQNTFSFSGASFFSPDLSFDAYTYAFYGSKTYTKLFPKWYLLTSWSQPSYLLEGHLCLNTQENLLDFGNFLGEVTVSEHLAFALEFRHRSRFDWRKADHENFLVDMARPISELENSPLSDGRNTLLGRLQLRLSPKWSFHASSHYGFGRKSEPSYRSFSLDAITLLSSKWQLKFSYLHTTNDDRFSMQMQLAK